MGNRNYYMIITSQKDYDIDVENNFNVVGFPERNRNSVKKFKKGDRIVFYITKKSVFGAIVEVVGEYFYDNKTQIWSDEYDLWPHRINCKPILVMENSKQMIFIKDIWDNLGFIKNKQKWGSQVQGSFKKLSEHDYVVIEKEMEKRRAE